MMSLLRSLFARVQTSPSPVEVTTQEASAAFDVAHLRALIDEKRFGDALGHLRGWLDSHGETPDLRLQHAALLLEWGRHIEARKTLSQIERPELHELVAVSMFGHLLSAAGMLAEAVPNLEEAARAGDKDAATQLCVSLRESGELARCVQHCDDVLRHSPENLTAWLTKALTHLDLGELELAEVATAAAQGLNDSSAVAWFASATIARLRGRYGEAIAGFRKAIAIDTSALPHGGFVDLAVTCTFVGRFDEALDVLREGLSRCPTPEMHRTFGETLLREGRFQEGLPQYEFRWMLDPLRGTRMRGSLPRWRGEPLVGKAILLRVEQGFGDVVQFMRYAVTLQERGANVVVGDFELARCYSGVHRVLGVDIDPGELDYYIDLLSVPLVLRTRVDTVPCTVPYLSASQDARLKWSGKLGSHANNAVGIAWKGNPQHPDDRFRSIPLAQLLPVVRGSASIVYSLQKVVTEDEAIALRDVGIRELGSELESFSDTAAVIDRLDLVITVDTAIAHLAGAMGKEVWMLYPFPGDWRWMASQDRTVWYPTMRLFRQKTRGDWSDPLRHLQRAFRDWRSGVPPHPVASSADLLVSLSDDAGVQRLAYGGLLRRDDSLLQYRSGDDPIARALELGDIPFWQALNLLGCCSLSGGTIVEVAAGVGHHTVRLAQMAGSSGGNVLVMESDPACIRLLKQNLAANDVSNVSVLSCSTDGDANCSRGSGSTVDDLRLASLSLLKIGLGSKPEDVLREAEQCLWGLRPRVWVEIAEGQRCEHVSQWLAMKGYRLWKVDRLAARDGFGAIGSEGDTPVCLIALPEESSECSVLENHLPIHTEP